MRKQLVTLLVASGLLVAAVPGLADHNSKNGEGWANMPNDIHNMRIETRESDDNEAFKDFVKYGEGSKTVNRFDSDEAQPTRANEQNGNVDAARTRDESQAQKKDHAAVKTATKDESRIESRSQLRTDAPTLSRPDRSATAARSGASGRRGGKR